MHRGTTSYGFLSVFVKYRILQQGISVHGIRWDKYMYDYNYDTAPIIHGEVCSLFSQSVDPKLRNGNNVTIKT